MFRTRIDRRHTDASPVGTLPFSIVYTYLQYSLHAFAVPSTRIDGAVSHTCNVHTRCVDYTVLQCLHALPQSYSHLFPDPTARTGAVYTVPQHCIQICPTFTPTCPYHVHFRECESRDTETHRNHPNVDPRPEHVPRGLGLKVFAQPII